MNKRRHQEPMYDDPEIVREVREALAEIREMDLRKDAQKEQGMGGQDEQKRA